MLLILLKDGAIGGVRMSGAMKPVVYRFDLTPKLRRLS